jgi:signal transduction histidine kinase
VEYSQASNALPGYHTRVIDDDGVVILGPPESNAIAADELMLREAEAVREWESLSRASEIASNLDISPVDARGQTVTFDLLDRSEIQHALNGEPDTAVRTSTSSPHRRILYAAYPIRSPEGDVVSVAYIASPLPRLTLSLLPDYFGVQTLGGASVAGLLAGLVGLLLARQLTRPLRELTDAASTLARGESAPPIPPASTSELRALGAAFNTMNVNLTDAHDALAAHAHQREVILNNLADAVLAADGAGEIILANPAASILLEIAPGTLRQAIRRTLDGEESHAVEVTARNQVIELLTTPLRDEDGRVSGAVAVGHDVTAYRQLDRLRTNFVSDVSHELRTPLTAVKGFVETLQDGAVDDPTVRDRFLDTIATETERLIRLTNDLLLLTRADAGRLTLHLASTDLADAVERAVAQLESRARDEGVSITVEPPELPRLALADADRIHQVLVNLLDNAIKFTPAGGRVSVSCAREGEQLACTIADTGPGVPAGEIPHLFERFYRGDPSRARDEAQGGAGLGLAIARAIVEAHGGQVWIESEPGQGTRVTFSLPSTP